MIHRVTHLARVGLVALLLATGLAWAFSRTPRGAQALCINPPHVSGVNIVKCDGTIIHLRGANQASAYNDKLYVILALFDDGQANDPTANGTLTQEDVNFLGTLASRYSTNTNVLGIDTINEPSGYTSWSEWLKGNRGSGIYGQQDAVNAIRNTGARQIIVLEPGGNAGGGDDRIDGAGCHHGGGWNGWSSTYLPSDQRSALMFSEHDYSDVVADRSDIVPCQFGSLNGSSGPYGVWPTYMGEWAGLAHPIHTGDCKSDGHTLSSSNADRYVTDWMNNLQKANAGNPVNWTGWVFRKYEMVTDNTSNTPTSYDDNTWTCTDTNGDNLHEGMGVQVKSWLATH